MSGRDCIGIAKTGSGKTLAFVLPMIRHIRDQSELRDGDGPIALIMAPTRELVQQIAKVGSIVLRIECNACTCQFTHACLTPRCAKFAFWFHKMVCWVGGYP
jgi:superfamily II DNA/RNA helicase